MASSLSAGTRILPIGLLLLGLLVAGCGSSQSTTRAPSSTPQRASDVERQLRAAADRWRGVPHKWGGTSRRGVDCSGLVQSVYDAEFGMALPRTSEDQTELGARVRRSALQPGDLVFFRHERKKYHVGIYLSDGEFLHASSSEGVTISPLDRAYWNERWWQGRRVLNPTAPPVSSADSTQSATSSEGLGW